MGPALSTLATAIDVVVEVRFERRRYAGRISRTTQRLRVVGVRDAQSGEYHLYVTNIPPEKLAAEDVSATYALRWQIELLFKELRRHYRLEDMPSAKRAVVEALLYAAILTLIVSRRLSRSSRLLGGRDRRRSASDCQLASSLVAHRSSSGPMSSRAPTSANARSRCSADGRDRSASLLVIAEWALTRPHLLRQLQRNGGTDAEPRWILPRRIPRPGQRGVHSSGWLVARFFVLRNLWAGAEAAYSEEKRR